MHSPHREAAEIPPSAPQDAFGPSAAYSHPPPEANQPRPAKNSCWSNLCYLCRTFTTTCAHPEPCSTLRFNTCSQEAFLVSQVSYGMMESSKLSGRHSKVRGSPGARGSTAARTSSLCWMGKNRSHKGLPGVMEAGLTYHRLTNPPQRNLPPKAKEKPRLRRLFLGCNAETQDPKELLQSLAQDASTLLHLQGNNTARAQFNPVNLTQQLAVAVKLRPLFCCGGCTLSTLQGCCL